MIFHEFHFLLHTHVQTTLIPSDIYLSVINFNNDTVDDNELDSQTAVTFSHPDTQSSDHFVTQQHSSYVSIDNPQMSDVHNLRTIPIVSRKSSRIVIFVSLV